MKRLIAITIVIAIFNFQFGFAPLRGSIFNRVWARGGEVLPVNRVIESDYIKYAETVVLDGKVDGDAFLAGGLVTVNGEVTGDIFVAGGKVVINGPVGQSVRVFGGDVTVTGAVGRNVLLIGGNLNIAKNATIGGSLVAVGGNLDLSASKIGRGFRFFGSRLYLNTAISSEAFVVANREFLLGPQASVSGDLKYTGQNEAVLEPGATVAGRISYQPQTREESFPKFFNLKKYTDVYQKAKPITETLDLLASLIIGFIFLGLFSKLFEKAVGAMENQPYGSIGWGIIAVLIFALVIVLFAVTIVGLPLALLLALAGVLISYVAKFVAAFFIGRRILLPKFGERRGWAMVLGLIVLLVVGAIPLFGGLIRTALYIFAVGALVLSYKQPEIYKQKSLPLDFSAPVATKRRGRPRR